MNRQRRQYFRLEYPRTCRPALVLADKTYAVTNLSEGGIKFQADDTSPFGPGQPVEMILRFTDGEGFSLAGEIQRIEKGAVCIRLSEPIPLKKIRSEEIHLIKNYPALRT